jgi:two-component system, chemotaxis family, sensor kinase CheA
VIVEADGKRIGLLVDDLLAQQQVVIKSLETNYNPVSDIAGATILGDGTVALIIDVPDLIRSSTARRGAAHAA